MGDMQHFCLRWNNYQNSITTAFENLRGDEDFIDVTLACDGKTLKAHRVVLSACSPYFRELLKSTPCKHPVIVLQDVVFDDLHALVEFIYHGEVNVHQNNLTSFLKTAEVLKVSGLTQRNSATATPTSSSPSSDHFIENLPPRFTTRSPGTPPEKVNSFQPPPFTCIPSTNSNEDRDSPLAHLQQSRQHPNKHNRRHLRSPTPNIRSSISRDCSPAPPIKRAKSADNHSPSPLNHSSAISPTTVLGEDMTVKPRKNSCDGSPPSRHSSPHDTSNYDENHNDEDTALAANREEQDGVIDCSIGNSLKKFECTPLPLSTNASPNNQPLKPEPLDPVYSHPNSNNVDNDNDDDDSSQWDRTSEPSPPASLFPQTPYEFEDGYADPRNLAKLLESTPFHAAIRQSIAFQPRHYPLQNPVMMDVVGGGSSQRLSLPPPPITGSISEPQDCPHCNRTFSCYYSLKRHFLDKHVPRDTFFVCEFCHRRYRTKNSLTTHKSLQHRGSAGILKQLIRSTATHISKPFVPQFQSTSLLFESIMYNNNSIS